MVCSANTDLIPPFSEAFQAIEKEWIQLRKNIQEFVHTSAFSDDDTRLNTFNTGGTFCGEPVDRVVYDIHEVLAKYAELANFFDRYADIAREEVETHLQRHKGDLWFFKALDTLYNPSEEDNVLFAFFQKGEWNGYNLYLETYRTDKARKEERGKTKNPNFVPQSIHICPPNCICYWDDTPEYEWNKEDKEESLASTNIRINWEKRQQFEREFLASDMLETLKPSWEHWMPKEHWYEFPTLELCKTFSDEYSIAVKPAVILLSKWLWKLPHEFYFIFFVAKPFPFPKHCGTFAFVCCIFSEKIRGK